MSAKSAGKKSARGKRPSRHIPESLRAYITGIVDMKSSGKAYILPDDKQIEDVFVAANSVGHALHGDYVRVLLFPSRVGRRLEGRIVEVLRRNKKNIVGTIAFSGKYAFLIPDSTNITVNILVPREKLHHAQEGQKAVARITDWPAHLNNPIGEIAAVLGEPGDNDVEMQSILAEYNFPLSYPKQAEKEAASMRSTVTPKELSRRRDFRDIYTCTIDPADAKDFDDALSFLPLPSGRLEVGVHIADVSHFVKEGGAIEQEAYERATSVYLVDRTIPMLPERLCNDLCSLKPDTDRFCFSVVFEMDEHAHILDTWIGKGVIHSNRRYAYEEAQQIIEAAGLAQNIPADPKQLKKLGDKQDIEAVTQLYKLSKILRDNRFKKGSINFHSQEVRFRLDPKTAKPLGVYLKESKEANHLVEEFMLAANRRVAEYIGKELKKKPFVYRVHDEPNPQKLNDFSRFLNKLGYKLNLKSRSGLVKSFNGLLHDIEGRAEQNMIETIAVRTMAKAVYTTQNIGHYGLSFPYYTHFTSPIRRYPDLMVHRLLERYMQGGKGVSEAELEDKCKHSSDMEKRATEAERTSVKYKQAEFLSDKIGQMFYGSVSGVSKWGIYVCLEENYCEGMVPLRSLTDDYYELDEENYQVVGLHSHYVYKLGQRVRIQVKEIDLNKKQLTFAFAPESMPVVSRKRR